jgi:hypothetical protein
MAKSISKDRKRIALSKKQRHEVDHIVSEYKIDRDVVEYVTWFCGRSRAIAYAILRIVGGYDQLPEKKLSAYQNRKVALFKTQIGDFKKKELKDQKFKNTTPYGNDTR